MLADTLSINNSYEDFSFIILPNTFRHQCLSKKASAANTKVINKGKLGVLQAEESIEHKMGGDGFTEEFEQKTVQNCVSIEDTRRHNSYISLFDVTRCFLDNDSSFR